MHILFLDDMEWRHGEFERVADQLAGVLVTRVYSAAAAISALNGGSFDQIFLDHDLSTDATGMDVVDHIMDMPRPPLDVIVHSCNAPAAARMASTLETHPAGIRVRRLPFPELLKRLHAVAA
jgi:DNA-binding NtrC family response regulator